MADKTGKKLAVTQPAPGKAIPHADEQSGRSWFRGEVDQRLAREFVRLKNEGKLKD